jgi:hypothetical protein
MLLVEKDSKLTTRLLPLTVQYHLEEFSTFGSRTSRDCKRSEFRVKGPDKQIQSVAQQLSVKFLIIIYLSHLPVISCKNLRLCRESLMLLEYHKKIGTLCLYQRI